jgi:hypothetical protein
MTRLSVKERSAPQFQRAVADTWRQASHGRFDPGYLEKARERANRVNFRGRTAFGAGFAQEQGLQAQ